jgi:hypothetical protein
MLQRGPSDLSFAATLQGPQHAYDRPIGGESTGLAYSLDTSSSDCNDHCNRQDAD